MKKFNFLGHKGGETTLLRIDDMAITLSAEELKELKKAVKAEMSRMHKDENSMQVGESVVEVTSYGRIRLYHPMGLITLSTEESKRVAEFILRPRRGENSATSYLERAGELVKAAHKEVPMSDLDAVLMWFGDQISKIEESNFLRMGIVTVSTYVRNSDVTFILDSGSINIGSLDNIKKLKKLMEKVK